MAIGHEVERRPEVRGFAEALIPAAFTPADTAVQTPNSDTPYSFVGLDLRAEPVPEQFGLRDLAALYYGMVTLVDDQLGKLLQALERNGLAGNTIVVFTSDVRLEYHSMASS